MEIVFFAQPVIYDPHPAIIFYGATVLITIHKRNGINYHMVMVMTGIKVCCYNYLKSVAP